MEQMFNLRLTLGSFRYDPFANVCVSFIFRKVIRIYRRVFEKKERLKLHLVSYKNLSALKSQSNLMNIFGLRAVLRTLCPVPGPGSGKTEVK